MKEIHLTQGKIALVDDEDYEKLNKFDWYAVRQRDDCWYAVYATGLKNNRVQHRMHRIAVGAPEDMYVDHIDGNGLNNQKSNLRLASQAQNSRNKRKHKATSSRYKGVSWHRLNKCWYARIMIDLRPVHLGYFDFEDEAAGAYDIAAVLFHGEFARLNLVGSSL